MAPPKPHVEEPSFSLVIRIPESALSKEYDYITEVPLRVMVRKKVQTAPSPEQADNGVASASTEASSGQRAAGDGQQEAPRSEPPSESPPVELPTLDGPKEQVNLLKLLAEMGDSAPPLETEPEVNKIEYQDPRSPFKITLDDDARMPPPATPPPKRSSCGEKESKDDEQLQSRKKAKRPDDEVPEPTSEVPTLPANDYHAKLNAALGSSWGFNQPRTVRSSGSASSGINTKEVIAVDSQEDSDPSATSKAISSQPLEPLSDSQPWADDDPYAHSQSQAAFEESQAV
ncbi:unnamed protein product [Prorocentrum cordatum]|uniref:Uncharacterized protein n=1 Tax=Prorocentrum cordatum TaxID=2364126 RepID=A0ABN9WCV3_9DINO|nr:unnamed protein product [Polarella glacialis]